MPKGQVTDEELESGLKGLSGFASLGGSPKLRRDSPFRDSTAEPKTIEVAPLVEEKTPEAGMAVPMVAVAPDPKPVLEQIRPKVQKEIRRVRPARVELPEKPASARKADIHTERVTLQISPSMRDAVASLARNLQRAKTTTDERITANTVMRVAVQLLLEHFQLRPGESANSEAELYGLVIAKLKLR